MFVRWCAPRHLNCLSELVEECGGEIDMSQLPIGDKTLSAKETWALITMLIYAARRIQSDVRPMVCAPRVAWCDGGGVAGVEDVVGFALPVVRWVPGWYGCAFP